MEGSYFTPEEYRREIKRLEKNLKARTRNIQRLGKQASQFAPEKLHNIMMEHPTKLSEMSPKELRAYYRELYNLNRKKSSTVKGAKDKRANFGYVEDKLKGLGDEAKSKLFNIYERVSEEFIEYGQEFKYEVFDVAADIVEQYPSERDIEELQQELLNELEELYERENLNDYTREELRDDFVQLMHRFQQFYLGDY